MPETAQEPAIIPAAAIYPFRAEPVAVMARDGTPYRPYALVLGATFFKQLDTPEKIAGLEPPLPTEIRHRTMRSERPFPRYALHDFGTHTGFVETGEEITDTLGRIQHTMIVGYTPESIAEEVKRLVLFALRHLGELPDEPQELPAEG